MTHALDSCARLDTPIHRWDPRWKLAAFSLLLLALALERPGARDELRWDADFLPAFVGLALSFAFLAAARLPVGFVARRLAAPAAFLAFLALVVPLSHPEKDASLGPLRLSTEGLRLALWIVVRALSMILLVFPMFSTAPFDRTMKALRRLRVPAPLVAILSFTYRYLFVYAAQYGRLRRALRARGLRPRIGLRTLRAAGNGLGVVLTSSIERTQRIHDAMRCRGYSGTASSEDDFRTRGADLALFAVTLALAAALVAWRWR
jgi:cobalt/nickel transport system permease protein